MKIMEEKKIGQFIADLNKKVRKAFLYNFYLFLALFAPFCFVYDAIWTEYFRMLRIHLWLIM